MDRDTPNQRKEQAARVNKQMSKEGLAPKARPTLEPLTVIG